jgi:hypothetical protein
MPRPDWPEDDADNVTVGHRVEFMEQHSGAAFVAVLRDLNEALLRGRAAILDVPGRKKLKHRDYMLAALAELWHRLGRTPASGDSSFAAFCEVVLASIGWPTSGTKSALPSAIKLWRLRYRRPSAAARVR